jgi:hypothetical protein
MRIKIMAGLTDDQVKLVKPIGAAILWIVEQGLAEAWTEVYDILSPIMIDSATKAADAA